MPTGSSFETRLSEAALRAAVVRLARPDGKGGAIVERAAVMAEGSPAGAIEAWIVDHGGEPEAPTVQAPAPGLYRLRSRSARESSTGPPRRYTLPASALDPQPDMTGAP